MCNTGERPPVVAMVSLGCAKNTVDSERVLGMLAERGFQIASDPEWADVVVVNTCAFIAPARAETEGTIRKLASRRPVVAIGCYPERAGRCRRGNVFRAREFPGVTFVRFAAFDSLAEICARVCRVQGLSGDPCRFCDAPRLRFNSPASAYLKIAEGCSNRCTYCAVPSIRGPMKSLPMEFLLDEAARLLELGAKELCLVAQDTGIYGLDLYGKVRLGELIRKLCELKGLSWLRLLYMHPAHLTDEIVETMAGEPKVCRYLDLPIQHASDRILKAMGRGYGAPHLTNLIEKLRRRIPGIALRTSVITGFPGETAVDFRELLDFIRRVRFDHLGAFAYSPEEGTPAYRMPGRPAPSTADSRRRQIMRLQQGIAFEHLRLRLGRTETALIESVAGRTARGRTEREAPDVDGSIFIEIKGDTPPVGSFARVELRARRGYDLLARVKSSR